MANTVYIESKAKVNLFLHIVGKNSNGYHNLDSFVGFLALTDSITLIPATEFKVVFEGLDSSALNSLPLSSNTVLVALNMLSVFLATSVQKGWLAPDFTFPYYTVLINKSIPNQAGLGGGTSNVARIGRYYYDYCLPYVSPLYQDSFTRQFLTLLFGLGSDIEICFYQDYYLRLQGIGQVKQLLLNKPLWSDSLYALGSFKHVITPTHPNLSAMVIQPPVKCPTKELFSLVTPELIASLTPQHNSVNATNIAQIPFKDWLEWLKLSTANDFESLFFQRYPELHSWFITLSNALSAIPSSQWLFRMTGTGSCFVVYSYSAYSQAVEAIVNKHSGSMQLYSTTLG